MIELGPLKKVPTGIGFDANLIHKGRQLVKYENVHLCTSDGLVDVLNEFYKLSPDLVNQWIERIQDNQNEADSLTSAEDPY